jgi:hypothetical protein
VGRGWVHIGACQHSTAQSIGIWEHVSVRGCLLSLSSQSRGRGRSSRNNWCSPPTHMTACLAQASSHQPGRSLSSATVARTLERPRARRKLKHAKTALVTIVERGESSHSCHTHPRAAASSPPGEGAQDPCVIYTHYECGSVAEGRGREDDGVSCHPACAASHASHLPFSPAVTAGTPWPPERCKLAMSLLALRLLQ